ncbi:MAG TPA: TRAP transporter small permease [Arcobacter sp.]|nr:TRAP transporter small permease [Arcobacter sp.]
MTNIFKVVDNIIDFINRFIAVIGITGGVALAFANVVARYGFNYSLTWAAELTIYLFLWSMFFGAAYCFRTDHHININLFVEYVSKKIAKVLLLITKSITFIFLLAVSYYGYEYLELVIDLEETSVDLEIPMWIPYLVIPVSFAFGAYSVILQIVKLIFTPASEIEFKSETEELMEVQNIQQVVAEANRKTGGML